MSDINAKRDVPATQQQAEIHVGGSSYRIPRTTLGRVTKPASPAAASAAA